MKPSGFLRLVPKVNATYDKDDFYYRKLIQHQAPYYIHHEQIINMTASAVLVSMLFGKGGERNLYLSPRHECLCNYFASLSLLETGKDKVTS